MIEHEDGHFYLYDTKGNVLFTMLSPDTPFEFYSQKVFTNALLERAGDLRGADLVDSTLAVFSIEDTDMRGADLRGVGCIMFAWRNIKMCGSDIRGAKFANGDFYNVDFRGARFDESTRFEKVGFVGCHMDDKLKDFIIAQKV